MIRSATSQTSPTMLFPPYMYIVFMFVFIDIGTNLCRADCDCHNENTKPCIEPGCELSFQTNTLTKGLMSQASQILFSKGRASSYNHSSKSLLYLLLLMSGSVDPNPGPAVPYPCGVCNRNVEENVNAICCDSCDVWYHQECCLSEHMFDLLKDTSLSWICCNCGLPNFSSDIFRSQDVIISSQNPFNPLLEDSVGETLDSCVADSLSFNITPPQHTSTPIRKQHKPRTLKAI